MFWKKKKAEQLFFCESNDRRNSFRVRPISSEPIATHFGGKPVTLQTIGAGGLSFLNEQSKVGESQSMMLDLPGQDVIISAKVEVVNVDKEGVCHCRFVDISDEFLDVIHRYVLSVQIRQVRMKKKGNQTGQGSKKRTIQDDISQDPPVGKWDNDSAKSSLPV